MPKDEEILADAYYIRDLVNHSDKTKELSKVFFEMLRAERAVTMNEMGNGFKLIKIRDVNGAVQDVERVLFSNEDYQRRSGMVEGLGWLEEEVQFYVAKANDEDGRKEKDKESEG